VGITVAVHDLFECLPFQGKMTKPTSHLFRGYLTGVMSVLFASHITVLETECIAKGDAECVFTTEQLASRTRS
jgi:predicted hydrocarbon binding protein